MSYYGQNKCDPTVTHGVLQIMAGDATFRFVPYEKPLEFVTSLKVVLTPRMESIGLKRCSETSNDIESTGKYKGD
jgi:hypothetical protein